MVLGVVLVVGAVLLLGCGDSTATTSTVTATETTTIPTASPTTEGPGTLTSTVSSLQGAVSEAVLESSGYTANCAGCHGAKGEGGSGPALSAYKDTSVVGLTSAINNGVGTMPGFKDKLSTGQVAALVGIIKSGFGLGATTTGTD